MIERRRQNPLVLDARHVMAALALLVDSLGRRARGFEVGGFLDGLGGLAHPGKERPPLFLYTGNFLVPRQPIGRSHGAFEVIVGEGKVEVVELLGVGVHVVDKFCIADALFLHRRFFLDGWRFGRNRLSGRCRLRLDCRLGRGLFLFGTTHEAQSQSEHQKRMRFHTFPQARFRLFEYRLESTLSLTKKAAALRSNAAVPQPSRPVIHPEVLPQSFYLRQDVVAISRELLGKVLCTDIGGSRTAMVITETEAYAGISDKASHAYGDRRTRRTEPMYGAGGTAYVYLCYGIHHLFNVVTNVTGVPHAVLVRAGKPHSGIPAMLRRRGKPHADRTLLAGPGSVARALGITTALTGSSLLDGPIRIEDHGLRIDEAGISIGSRVGVDYAGEDASRPYRFRLLDGACQFPGQV